jgi:hypothetical protein
MEEVRDDACRFMEMVLGGKMRDAASKQLYQAYKHIDEDSVEVLNQLVVSSIDACLVRFLNYFDKREIPLSIQHPSGEQADVRAMSDGLVGELYGDSGWIARFSKFKDRISP